MGATDLAVALGERELTGTRNKSNHATCIRIVTFVELLLIVIQKLSQRRTHSSGEQHRQKHVH